MKKTLVLILSFLLTGSAFASKARLQALGDDKDGSFFIDDFRNIFLNSAHVNNHKDMVFIELGGNGTGAGTTQANIDGDGNQKAMGGFLKSAGNFVYGLYLGNESDTDQLLRISSWSDGSILSTTDVTHDRVAAVDNVTDFFFGGESAGIKWGVNLVYSSNEDESLKRKDNRSAVRLGMIKDNMQAFANISTGNEAEDTDATDIASGGTGLKFDGSMGYHVGGSYQFGDWTPYVSYKTGDWDNIDGTIKTEGSFTEIKVGAGHKRQISKSATLFTRVNYFSEEVELKYASNPTSAKLTSIPLTLGYEVQAKEWLTLRGSVSTNLMGKRKTKNIGSLNTVTGRGLFATRYNGSAAVQGDRDETISNSTIVSAGATLQFGRLSVDGMIGNSGVAGTVTDAGDKKGVLALDRLMSRVAMTYSF